MLLETLIRKQLRFEKHRRVPCGCLSTDGPASRALRGVPQEVRRFPISGKSSRGVTCLCGSGPGNGATARGGWKVPAAECGGEDFPGAEPWVPGDQRFVPRGSRAGAGVELAGNRAPVRTELEERGEDRDGGGVGSAAPRLARRCLSWASLAAGSRRKGIGLASGLVVGG